MSKTRTSLWSCGGGTQSAAIAGLIMTGKLPRPDHAVIIDTEREKASTWAYLEKFIAPALRKVNLEIWRVPKSQFATVDLYGLNGDLLLPAFTTASGTVGKLSTYCSNEWKARCKQRYARSIGLDFVEDWLGMSSDEVRRVRNHDSNWWHFRYPLIWDVRMSRRECVAFVESLGWDSPPRSACYICPNMGNPEWREIRDNRPDEFEKAISEDDAIREVDPHAFLHFSGVPLRIANLDTSNPQPSLFSRDCMGMCDV